MAYEIDRDHSKQPSLREMAIKAIELLDSASENGNGFFLMIEGSRIGILYFELLDFANHEYIF